MGHSSSARSSPSKIAQWRWYPAETDEPAERAETKSELVGPEPIPVLRSSTGKGKNKETVNHASIASTGSGAHDVLIRLSESGVRHGGWTFPKGLQDSEEKEDKNIKSRKAGS